jgi:putative flavoprotein involved in K+ transport
VLVVGSAQSGCQIAEDPLGAGRRVVLSTSAIGRVPARYRGRETLAWLAEVAFFDQRPRDLPDPAMMREA